MLAHLSQNIESALRILDVPIVATALKVILVFYGALYVPSLSLDKSKWFHNTWVRIGALALVLWTSLKDVGLSLLIAAIFFLGSWFASRKAMATVVSTGKVEGMSASILSGGWGPVLKTPTHKLTERFVMQASVDESKFNPPADDASQVHQDAIDTIVDFQNKQMTDTAKDSDEVGTDPAVDRNDWTGDDLSGMVTKSQSDLAPEDDTVDGVADLPSLAFASLTD